MNIKQRTDAAALTLDSFRADMATARDLLRYVLGELDYGTLPRINSTSNFNSRQTHARIWLALAVKLCARHGITLQSRRVTRDEREMFAALLLLKIDSALAAAEIDAIEVTFEPSKIYFAPSLNTRLTPAKLVRTTHTQGVSDMLKRLAIVASILAICFASVSCVAHTVYTF